MDFKELFGEEALTLEQFTEKLQAGNIKLANLAEGTYVDKSKYDAKVSELEAANNTVSQLKNEMKDNEGLQQKISEYESVVQKMKDEAALNAKTYALKAKLTEAGAVDADYLIYKQGGIDKFTFDDTGKPVGVDDILNPLKESSPHLFKVEQNPGYNPSSGNGAGGEKNPWKKESFNLTEQGKILKTDPAKAKQLASAAGVNLNI